MFKKLNVLKEYMFKKIYIIYVCLCVGAVYF